jgi:hypothetical protein
MLTKEQEDIVRKMLEALLPANEIMNAAIARGKMPVDIPNLDIALRGITDAVGCLRNLLRR